MQHYKRKSDTVYVEFSNDGLTWESIRINKDYWYYQQTENPDTVQVSIPSTIQTQPFYLRFRFQGECGFAWLMDDLMIFEKEQYAAKIESQILLNGMSYSVVNHCVMDTLDHSFSIKNFGFDTLFNVVIRTDVFEDGSNELILIHTIPIIYPLETFDTLFKQIDISYYSGVQNYDFTTKVYSDDLDTLVLMKSLERTWYPTRRDFGTVKGNFLTDDEIFGVGQTFTTNQEYCVVNSKLYIPNEPAMDGSLLYIAWYKFENGVWIFNGASIDFVIQTAMLGTWFSIQSEFDDYYYENDTGLVVISAYGAPFYMSYSNKTEENTVYFLDNIGNLIPQNEAHAFLFELNTYYLGYCDCNASLEENNEGALEIYPNPASTEIQIENLTEPISTIKIISIDGREMYAEKNPDSEKISISFLQSGTYLIFIETESGLFYSEKFVKI